MVQRLQAAHHARDAWFVAGVERKLWHTGLRPRDELALRAEMSPRIHRVEVAH